MLTARGRCCPVLVAAALACSDATSPPAPPTREPIDLSGEWVVSAPAEEQIDGARLNAALRDAAGLPGLRSLLIVRHAHLVAERYFASAPADSLYALRSVTKSVISLLVGIAIQHGAIRGTNQPLSELFHPPLPVLDATRGAITVADLLTMTSGFEWDEGTAVSEYNNWALAPDQIEYLLARPLVSPPGTQFNYNSAAVHLLSAVLEVNAGGTAAFADAYLFRPLGIQARVWELDDRGIPNGGAGLYLRPRDLAKVGQLVLQQGRSGATVVVSPGWILESTQPHLATGTQLGSLGLLDYGDLWWLGKAAGHDFVLAWGYGGQFVYIVPDLDLVLVATATWQGLGGGAGAQAAGIANLIVNEIMLAVH